MLRSSSTWRHVFLDSEEADQEAGIKFIATAYKAAVMELEGGKTSLQKKSRNQWLSEKGKKYCQQLVAPWNASSNSDNSKASTPT